MTLEIQNTLFMLILPIIDVISVSYDKIHDIMSVDQEDNID